MKPILLDLFCGPGGACKGYQRAGFYVVGIDSEPQSHYCGDEFYQRDAFEALVVLGAHADAIHASPPCQHYARVTEWRGKRSNHPDLVARTREALVLWEGSWHRPWIIENVCEAPLRKDLVLCGTMFGLNIQRHRAFEVNFPVVRFGECHHTKSNLPFIHKGERRYADEMGCTWMNKREARQAIPPVYCEFIGRQLMSILVNRTSNKEPLSGDTP